MADLNEIFGYKVYKPPPEKEMNVIADLNFRGEVVTLINTDEDVIQNAAFQEILQSLDGERTVKIEDLPPDVRYDGFNKKALYDNRRVTKTNHRSLLEPQRPRINQNLFKVTSEQDSEKYHKESIKAAQMKAARSQQQEQDMLYRLQGNRNELQNSLVGQLTEALHKRNQMNEVSPQHQAYIEKLYLDLRLINPDLALSILTGSNAHASNQTQYIATGGAMDHVKSSKKRSSRHKHY